jgi:sugar/nucleoside kinase (ribokinase family)
MSKACLVGNLNADLVLYPLRDFPAWGSEIVTRHMSWRPGGIANALLCLARLGVRVSVIANVGDDAIGQELVSRLGEPGVDVSHIERSADAHTAVSVGLGREGGERAFVTNLGHLERLDLELVLRHRHAWQDAQCVLISGYFLLPGLGFAGTRSLMASLRAEGKRILFDVGWDVEGWPERSVREVMELLGDVDVFLPSLNEAQALTGESEPRPCLERLHAACPRFVIIKMGEDGSIASTEQGIFERAAFPVNAMDTTGAGDCFNSGIILGMLNGWDMAKTLLFANALAAIVISRPREAGYPTWGEVQAYLQDR